MTHQETFHVSKCADPETKLQISKCIMDIRKIQ